MTPLARLRKLGKESGGAALVEFTVVAPLLLGLMCGLAEFGQMFRQYQIMQKGVRDAARYLSHVSAQPPCTGISDPNWGTEVANAQNLAVYGTTTAGTALFAGWTDTTTVSVPAPACLTNPRVNGASLPQITVTASAPYADLGMLGFLGIAPITLTVSHQELKVT